MNYKLKNILIDSIYPLIFWGTIYLIVAVWITGWWSYRTYFQWYFMLIVLAPLSGVSGRVLNSWRKIWKYNYSGYE